MHKTLDELIKRGKNEDAMKLIASHLEKLNSDKSKRLSSRITALSSRQSILKQSISQGVISQEEINLERNRITKSIIEIKQELKENLQNETFKVDSEIKGSRDSNSKKSDLIVIVTIGIFLIGTIILINKGVRTKDPYQDSYFIEFLLSIVAFALGIIILRAIWRLKKNTAFHVKEESLEFRSIGFNSKSKIVFLDEIVDCFFMQNIWDRFTDTGRVILKLENEEHLTIYGWGKSKKMKDVSNEIRERAFLARKNKR